MHGFQRRKKGSQSELIEGQGTGTTDSIKKNVPAGSYIMPADSTQKIGSENLENMGSPTPVNLSNGEFQLSPDQVHSVGVQALEDMKNQTHMPVDQPQFGFKTGQNKPKLFFANGGLVPFEEEARRQAHSGSTNRMIDVTPKKPPATLNNAQPMNTAATVASNAPKTEGFGARALSGLGNAAKGLGKFHVAGAGLGGAVTGYNTSTEQYAERMGLDPNAERGVLAETGIRAAGVLSDVGNAASFGILGRRFPDKQRINAENDNAAQQKRFDEWNAKKNNGTVANPFGSEVNNNIPVSTASPLAPQQQDPYAIQQSGNSFSYANPAAATHAREQGIPEGQSSNVIGGIKRTNDPRGVANLFASTREIGASEQQIQDALARREMDLGMRGYGGINRPETPQRTPEQEAERQRLIKAASTPISGARGITANQMRMLGELQQGDDNRSQQRYVTDANNAASVLQTGMREVGQTGRTAMQERGTNDRFGANLGFDAQKFQATNDLANREFNLNATEKGFGIRNSARVEKLYQQLDGAKTDEDRKSIQEKINRYTGGKAESGKDRYMTVGGGQEWNNEAMAMVNRPHQLFDTKTQQFIDTPAKSSSNLPKTGEIRDGYRFKGGDPNKQSSWEAI